MRPDTGQVLHFSEDPTIKKFVPHVAKTSRQARPYVWAVGFDRCPDYCFLACRVVFRARAGRTLDRVCLREKCSTWPVSVRMTPSLLWGQGLMDQGSRRAW
ncbi:DUF6886 family protein [Nonomuraea dietziae]|uniref:DUF6886 family protein n=1 Tax=Nonomuraea dietziae TaxID=65515 RepID=UPI0031D4FE01